MKKILLLSAVLLSVLTYACKAPADKDEAGSEAYLALGKGQMAKDFTLPELNGGKVTLSGLKGKVVLLNFWATWCPPCREEMPSMEKLHKEYGGKDLAVIAVAIDRKGEVAVKHVIDEKGFTFTVLIDSSGDVSDLYGVFAVPTTFVIGRDGAILEKVQGVADWFSEEAREYFEGLVGAVEKT